MKKKGFLFSILFIILISASFVVADEAGDVQEAYNCLKDKISGQTCSRISLGDRIFSLMAVGDCKSEIVSEVGDIGGGQQCWPEGNCDVKTTAQALLALDRTDFDISKGADWLLSKNITPDNLIWYLQVDAQGLSTCSISFDGGSYSFIHEENKKLTGPDTTCFAPAQNDYWLEIGKTCLDKEFAIVCDDVTFSTNFIYKIDDPDSDIFYIADQTSINSAGSSTTEKINSYCFSKSGTICDYEASLWAVLALSYIGDYSEEVSLFIPYLVTNKDETINQKYIPEAFIYYAKDYAEFRAQLLQEQGSDDYWNYNGDRFFGTAVALYPLWGQEPREKTDAKVKLLANRNADGCWGSITNTAFILHSLWEYEPAGVDCYENSDCFNDEICLNNECVPDDADCTEDRDCTDSSEPVCVDNYCEECEYTGDCDGEFCSPDYTCEECVDDEDCTQEGFGCNEDYQCSRLPECTDDGECTEPGQICSLAGYCIDANQGCDRDTDCTNGFCVNEVCVDCRGSNYTDCSTGYDCIFNGCVPLDDECELNSECDDDEECDNGVCVPLDDETCQDKGLYCRHPMSCLNDGGTIMQDYSCPSSDKCCDIDEIKETCSEMRGVICNSEQTCSGTSVYEASDLRSGSGESCCVGGICETGVVLISDCEMEGGNCYSSCTSDEEEINYDCDDFSEKCCVVKTIPLPEETSYLWVWILLILIILVVVGIVFKDKLRILLMRFKGGGKSRPPRPGFPPGPRPMMPRPISRRIIPAQRRYPGEPSTKPRPAPLKPKGDLDDVLKKLKEIGK
ncbi:MAG: hypothetical protein ABIH59_01175 [archaeon]